MLPIPNYLSVFLEIDSDVYPHLELEFLKNSVFKNLTRKEMIFLSKKLGVSDRSLYYYIIGKKRCSLKNLVKIADLRDIPNFLDAVYTNLSLISTQGHLPSKVPKEFTVELAYLTGFICGDGHVSKGSYVRMYNDSQEIIQKIVPDFVKTVFDYSVPLYKKGNCYMADINSKPINVFFRSVIRIPAGKKKGRLRVPEFIFLNDEFKAAFLVGLFDSDGGVTLSKKGKLSILISSSTPEFLLEIVGLLKTFSVNLGGPYASGGRKGLELRSYDKGQVKMFFDRIGSYHPKKLGRFKASVVQR